MTLQEFAEMPLDYIEAHMKESRIRTFGSCEPMIVSNEEAEEMLLQMTPIKEHELLDMKLDEYYHKESLKDFSGPIDFHIYDRQTEETVIHEHWDIISSRATRFFPAYWHDSEYFDAYYVYQGSPLVHFQNHNVQLQPGDVLLIASNVIHGEDLYHDNDILQSTAIRASTFQDTCMKTVAENPFLYSFFQQALSGTAGNEYLLFHTADDMVLRELFYHLYEECNHSATYQRSLTNALMNLIFALLLRNHSQHMVLPPDSGFHWQQKYGHIFSYMEQHYNTVTLEELAQRYHYSTRQLIRIFENCTGSTFTRLIRQRKLQKACDYLQGTEYSMERISELIGYDNPASFYRAFKSQYQVTPMQWRKGLHL